MSNNLISVIMAAYNRQKYVIEAIESVLSQNVELELIIIDDGSTDNTKPLIESYIEQHNLREKIRLYTQKNQGWAAAQNYAMSYANGDYFAFIDSDDIWLPNKLAQQYKLLSEQTDLDMVFGHVQQFISPELTTQEQQKIYCPAIKQPGLLSVGMCIKRSAFYKVGEFNSKWQKGSFIDWFARAQEQSLKYSVLDDVVFKRRLHTSNLANVKHSSNLDYVRLLKEKLNRQRVNVESKETSSKSSSIAE